MERTYPAEITVVSGTESIVSSIRGYLGDRKSIYRYYLPVSLSATSSYIVNEDLTFYEPNQLFWPYNLSVSGTEYSELDNPAVISYQYMVFSDVPSDSLRVNDLDFWVEIFKISDREIWEAYSRVDLTSIVFDPDCITDQMLLLQAALNLVPVLKSRSMDDMFTEKRVRDGDTEYDKRRTGTADPYLDLTNRLSTDLQRMIDKCNKRQFNGWVRIE